MTIYSSILPGKCHTLRSLVSYSSWDCRRVIYDLSDQTTRITEDTIFSKQKIKYFLEAFGLITLRKIIRHQNQQL